jgi:hypothetical protein
MANGYNSRLPEYRNEWNGISLPTIADYRYSAEEIRFNLLAIAQRPLPILHSQLADLNNLSSQLESHLNDLIPDWKALSEYVPASESQVDSTTIAKAIEESDTRILLSLKKALERDIAILKPKIRDEEEKISEYMVCQMLI